MEAAGAGAAGDSGAGQLSGHRARWAVLAVVCLAELVVVLDHTVLNVAIPSLTADLGASTADIQWVINAYALVQAGLLLTAGNTADRYGRKRMLLAGLALFGAGSLAAGLAATAGQLIAARAFMGVGAALLLTTTLAVVLQVFDAAERPKAIGVWAAVNALGFAAGPVVGGVVLTHFAWGAVFLINIPVVLFALAAVVALVPESRDPGAGRPDPLGAALSVLGMTAVVYAVISGPGHGWTSPEVLLTALLGLTALGLFTLWERRVPHPVLDPRLFRSRRFTGAVTGVVLITFGSGGALYLLTQQLQFLRGATPLEAGWAVAPFAVTVVVLNATGLPARCIARLGLPAVISGGMALLAAGFAVVALAGDGSYGLLLPGLVFMGTGCAFANPAIAEAVMGAIPREKAGAGAGVNSTMAELGAGLGVAVLGAVLASRFAAGLPGAAAGAESLPAALERVSGPAEREAALQAFASGLETGQLVGAAAVLLGGCVAGELLRRAPRPGTGPTATGPDDGVPRERTEPAEPGGAADGGPGGVSAAGAGAAVVAGVVGAAGAAGAVVPAATAPEPAGGDGAPDPAAASGPAGGDDEPADAGARERRT
ncbi:MFS transporter [Streptomyces zingiberis]|uniref:MFS transporter n=1 Tax=Streptomyces zingiberis TaxID=2053010 RepID=UPI002893214C|nr:MFS transporter [Streptomyces zingiberis]